MSQVSHNQIANQIRSYREKRGLRQWDVAKLIGQSSSAHVSHWEKGRELPSFTNALRLSAAIKCPIEILFFGLFDQLRKDIYENKKKHQIEYTFD